MRETAATYVGKSAIFAPQELTPRLNGVLVEMGGPRSEGVVAAEWDFAALRHLWESSDTPVRRTLSSAELGSALGEIYASLRRLPSVADRPLLAGSVPDAYQRQGSETVELDDLAVVESYADAWPADRDGVSGDQKLGPSPGPGVTGIAADDVDVETDEMDALPGREEDAGD